ncbi:MAG: AAA family ATPase [Planctomycetes bacterium]|nr:AAA family ATPase [Planctomycetota bacterium]
MIHKSRQELRAGKREQPNDHWLNWLSNGERQETSIHRRRGTERSEALEKSGKDANRTIGNLGNLYAGRENDMTDERLVRLNTVVERPHEDLWEDRIGLGSLTILEGPPGSGKSCVTNDLAARVTTGRPMPLCTRRREPAGVVLLQGEDGLANDVKPNLRAAGADPDKVIAYNRLADSENPFTLPGDIKVLADAITEVDAQLVVIDPITAFFSASVNHDQSVRTVSEVVSIPRTGEVLKMGSTSGVTLCHGRSRS